MDLSSQLVDNLEPVLALTAQFVRVSSRTQLLHHAVEHCDVLLRYFEPTSPGSKSAKFLDDPEWPGLMCVTAVRSGQKYGRNTIRPGLKKHMTWMVGKPAKP